MPVITVQISKSEPSQVADLIQGLTAAAVEATKIPAQAFIVVIQELDSDNMGVGGQSLTQIRASR